MWTPRHWSSRDRSYVALAAGFAISRLVVHSVGVRFSTDYLWVAIQNLDPELLRTRLAESIWYLHAQPPLFNLFLGGVLKAFPRDSDGAFYALYLAFGLVGLIALYALLVRLGVGRQAAAGIAFVFSVTPAVLLYETWLFYDYPMLVLLTTSALAVHIFADRPTTGRALLLFALAAAIVLVRSIYQLPWFLLVGGLLLAARRREWRRIAAAAALPLALVCLVYVKNLALFGTPTTSSWFGMNLAKITVFVLPEAERRELVRRGELSRLALIEPFSPPAAYRSALGREHERGVPALDEEVKSGDRRYANGNNAVYLTASAGYRRDALYVMRERPATYARGVKLALERYFWPADYSGPPARNKERLARWEGLWLALLGSTAHANRVAFVIVFAYLAALGYGLALTIRFVRSRERSPETTALVYVWLTLVYTSLVAVLTDLGENFRSRFPLDAVVLALVAVATQRALARARQRGRALRTARMDAA